MNILITLENSDFETVFIVNHVLKVPLVPKVPSYNENRIFVIFQWNFCFDFIDQLISSRASGDIMNNRRCSAAQPPVDCS
ncbi:MAG: hypothetical protein LBC02_06255, partial [Planctomycetaceae bacterium]|nr:hypothetical protein [Planctomycetaceae bacterium]